MKTTRREFLASATCAAATLAAPIRALAQAHSPFRISVITDEISDDFDHACSVAANDFGLQWVELRSLWKKTVTELPADDVARAQAVLAKYNLRVTDIGSPLFKVHWPGAPRSTSGSQTAPIPTNLSKQEEVLAAAIEVAKQFKTDKIRCFDFWRLEDPTPYRAAMDDKLRAAADTCKQQGIALVLENEQECNTATAPEAVRLLGAVPNLGLNWDPGNAVWAGEHDAFPIGWRMLPKNRILHCHCKNTVVNDAGKPAWSPVDVGLIDWPAQFRALKAIGYHNAVSLETHWRGAGTAEASSRISWAGMKKSLEAAEAL